MPEDAVYTRNARGCWRVFPSLTEAVEAERRLAGDRRGKTELSKLFEGVWLYVGPRPRRRTSRHVVHVMTFNGATLLGTSIPPSLQLHEVWRA